MQVDGVQICKLHIFNLLVCVGGAVGGVCDEENQAGVQEGQRGCDSTGLII